MPRTLGSSALIARIVEGGWSETCMMCGKVPVVGEKVGHRRSSYETEERSEMGPAPTYEALKVMILWTYCAPCDVWTEHPPKGWTDGH